MLQRLAAVDLARSPALAYKWERCAAEVACVAIRGAMVNQEAGARRDLADEEPELRVQSQPAVDARAPSAMPEAAVQAAEKARQVQPAVSVRQSSPPAVARQEQESAAAPFQGSGWLLEDLRSEVRLQTLRRPVDGQARWESRELPEALVSAESVEREQAPFPQAEAESGPQLAEAVVVERRLPLERARDARPPLVASRARDAHVDQAQKPALTRARYRSARPHDESWSHQLR